MAASDPRIAGIEPLRPDDAPALAPLAHEAGWNQVPADWRLMLGAGTGFGIRGARGGWVGSALVLPLGSSIAWISMVLVTAAERGRGLGTALLRRCIAEVEAMGASAGLDATELGRPIYLPLGFGDVYTLSRWHAGRGVRGAVPPPAGISIRPARPADLAAIAACDRRCTGFSRAGVVADLVTRAAALAHVAERGDGSLAGFALGRDGARTPHVGPVCAEDEAIGLALLSAAMAAAGGPVIADVPDAHQAVRRWLQEQGATVPRGFVRMMRGGTMEGPARVLAVAGPELA